MDKVIHKSELDLELAKIRRQGGGSGNAIWGGITGNIENQTDLINRTDTIHIDTTAHWDAQQTLVGQLNHIYVYSDYQSINGVSFPGIKVGDGAAYLIDAPFIAANNTELNSHINNTGVHVTASEKLSWNDKVTCFISQGDSETVVFSKE